MNRKCRICGTKLVLYKEIDYISLHINLIMDQDFYCPNTYKIDKNTFSHNLVTSIVKLNVSQELIFYNKYVLLKLSDTSFEIRTLSNVNVKCISSEFFEKIVNLPLNDAEKLIDTIIVFS